MVWKNKRSIYCNIVSIVTLTFNNGQLFIYDYVHCIKTKENYGNRSKVLKTLCTVKHSYRSQVTKATRYCFNVTSKFIANLFSWNTPRHSLCCSTSVYPFFFSRTYFFRYSGFQDVLRCVLPVYFLRRWVAKNITLF